MFAFSLGKWEFPTGAEGRCSHRSLREWRRLRGRPGQAGSPRSEPWASLLRGSPAPGSPALFASPCGNWGSENRHKDNEALPTAIAVTGRPARSTYLGLSGLLPTPMPSTACTQVNPRAVSVLDNHTQALVEFVYFVSCFIQLLI